VKKKNTYVKLRFGELSPLPPFVVDELLTIICLLFSDLGDCSLSEDVVVVVIVPVPPVDRDKLFVDCKFDEIVDIRFA